jgi:hypothetical protein
VTRDIWIRDVAQKVRVVVIQIIGERIILLSTDLALTARQIIILYAMRFAAELGIRDAKQRFGFGDYQCTSFGAMTRFVGLSLISLCLSTKKCESIGGETEPKNPRSLVIVHLLLSTQHALFLMS